MKVKKLNQVVAAEKEIKQKVTSAITEVHQISQKPVLFSGFNKDYSPLEEGGEKFPSENQKVQYTVADVVSVLIKNFTELFDATATKDYANCNARASVKVGDTVLVKDAPIPFLLFLEKQLDYVKTFIQKLPVLDLSEVWIEDKNSGLWRTEVTKTHRNKKLQKPIVLYPATTEHPAQTQLITDDVLAGYWEQTKFSGAIPAPKKTELLARLAELSKAVVEAREEANTSDAPEVNVGKELLNYIFG
ncbi:MAG TPA: hypothetical protein PLP33_14785 [Leptospiraceae bacterium]|nr:hypothetical protein [Leptospiraceae bacterium]